MVSFILQFVILAAAIWIISMIIPGVKLKNFKAALVVGGVYSLLNVVMKFIVFKVFLIISLPLQILTLGLFGFFLNVVLLRITDNLLDDFELSGWGAAIFASIGISVVNMLLTGIFT